MRMNLSNQITKKTLATILIAVFVVATLFSLFEAKASIHPVQRVSIVEDHENAAFRFMIDGREVARIDGTGLHVRENVEFGGTMIDIGTAEYDARSTPKSGANADGVSVIDKMEADNEE